MRKLNYLRTDNEREKRYRQIKIKKKKIRIFFGYQS